MERPAPCFDWLKYLLLLSGGRLSFCKIETPRRGERGGLRGENGEAMYRAHFDIMQLGAFCLLFARLGTVSKKNGAPVVEIYLSH
jgi:hypothetical protein